MSELSDYQRLVEMPNVKRLSEENSRLRTGLERAKGAIQTLAKRLPPGDFAAQHIVDEELKLAVAALHPPKAE